MHHYTNKHPAHIPAPYQLEVVVAAGLEELARAELRQLGRSAQIVPSAEAGLLQLRYHGNLRSLLELQLATSVYMLHTFAVPRPRALLGDQQLRMIRQLSTKILDLHPPGSFRTLYLSAAGDDSTILSRLKGELAASLGLSVGSDDGDLLLRLRREPTGGGWQLLLRISPRPLATRAWRVCNREGALNGPVAHAMASPTPRPTTGISTLAVARARSWLNGYRLAQHTVLSGVIGILMPSGVLRRTWLQPAWPDAVSCTTGMYAPSPCLQPASM